MHSVQKNVVLSIGLIISEYNCIKQLWGELEHLVRVKQITTTLIIVIINALEEERRHNPPASVENVTPRMADNNLRVRVTL
jgi:hypothetical protein